LERPDANVGSQAFLTTLQPAPLHCITCFNNIIEITVNDRKSKKLSTFL